MARLPAEREEGRQLDFVVDRRRAGAMGVIGLGEWSLRDRRAVIGTWLGRAHWGTGANLEAKALLLRLAFGVLGLERIGAYAAHTNPRSPRGVGKLGASPPTARCASSTATATGSTTSASTRSCAAS